MDAPETRETQAQSLALSASRNLAIGITSHAAFGRSVIETVGNFFQTP